MRFRFLLILCIVLFTSLLPAECRGEALLRAAFPYSLTKEAGVAHAGSTQLLYISVQNFGNEEEAAEITAALPEGFTALAGDGWEVDGQEVCIHWTLPADYGEQFLAVPVKCSEEAGEGVYEIPVSLRTKEGVKEERISFSAGPAEEEQDQKAAQTWYIQSVLLPVNEDGERDARQEKDTLVTPDVTLENMKNRLTGGRGVDWDALTAKPNTYLLLDMRNPKKDVRTIHLSAELVDKETGEVRPGLIAAAGEGESLDRTKMRSEAALSLNGHKMQTAVVPLYVDPFSIAEGDYALRLTLFDGETERVTELPLTVVKKRSVGFATLGFALLSLLALAASIGGLKRCILSIGAKGGYHGITLCGDGFRRGRRAGDTSGRFPACPLRAFLRTGDGTSLRGRAVPASGLAAGSFPQAWGLCALFPHALDALGGTFWPRDAGGDPDLCGVHRDFGNDALPRRFLSKEGADAALRDGDLLPDRAL